MPGLQIQSVGPLNTATGQIYVNEQVVLATTDTFMQTQTNVITNTQIVVQGTATGVIITPPSTNTNAILLKGATSADAGVPLNKTQPSFIALDPSVSFFYMTAAPGTLLTFTWV